MAASALVEPAGTQEPDGALGQFLIVSSAGRFFPRFIRIQPKWSKFRLAHRLLKRNDVQPWNAVSPP
jgi:hypothetical protein